jgi:hypothetical protein
MEFIIDAPRLSREPGLRSPLALGLLVRLIACLKEGETTIEFNSRAWAEAVTATKAQIETAMRRMTEHGVINVNKDGGPKRGVWLVDLTPALGFASGSSHAESPQVTPVRALMDEWDERYKQRTGTKYWRTQPDFYREKKLWCELHREIGGKLPDAMNTYFGSPKYSQWQYCFSVFYRNAERLLNTHQTQQTWRF